MDRNLSLPWQSRAMQDVLQSLFLSELISPSSDFWLLSGWVSDIEVIDNRSRAFSGIRPDLPSSRIRLSKVVEIIVSLGAKVYVVMRDVDYNKPFHWKLKEIQKTIPNRLGVAMVESAHEKAIVGNDFVLSGSMNFTNSGLTSNTEQMLLRVDRAVAAQHQINLMAHWEKKLKWQ